MSMIMMIESVSATEPVNVPQSKTDQPFKLKIFTPESDASNDISSDPTDEVEWDDDSLEVGESICLEKTWHGIHFLLAEDAWSGAGESGFLVAGGREVGEDTGYGPMRVFGADEVKEISRFLNGISGEEFWAGYDANRFSAAGIYPNVWDEPADELEEEYVNSFEMLKEFVTRVAEAGDSMRISLE